MAEVTIWPYLSYIMGNWKVTGKLWIECGSLETEKMYRNRTCSPTEIQYITNGFPLSVGAEGPVHTGEVYSAVFAQCDVRNGEN